MTSRDPHSPTNHIARSAESYANLIPGHTIGGSALRSFGTEVRFRDVVAGSPGGFEADFVQWPICRENVFAADDGVSA
jgi:hypothetical protein